MKMLHHRRKTGADHNTLLLPHKGHFPLSPKWPWWKRSTVLKDTFLLNIERNSVVPTCATFGDAQA